MGSNWTGAPTRKIGWFTYNLAPQDAPEHRIPMLRQGPPPPWFSIIDETRLAKITRGPTYGALLAREFNHHPPGSAVVVEPDAGYFYVMEPPNGLLITITDDSITVQTHDELDDEYGAPFRLTKEVASKLSRYVSNAEWDAAVDQAERDMEEAFIKAHDPEA